MKILLTLAALYVVATVAALMVHEPTGLNLAAPIIDLMSYDWGSPGGMLIIGLAVAAGLSYAQAKGA